MKPGIAVAVLGMLAGTPVLACTYPEPPSSVPDGRTAVKATMIAKKKEFDRYRLAVLTYLDCEADSQRRKWVQVDLEKVAKRFNDAVREFKEANGDG